MRYESYKSIDLPWLNEIPSHWKIERNKHLLISRKELVGKMSHEYTLLSLTLKGIIKRNLENAKGKFPESFDNYKKVEPNNLVFCLFDMDETPRTVGLSCDSGMITGAYDVYQVKGMSPKFLTYYWINVDNKKALKPYYKSLRKTITSDSFLSIDMPIPPLNEQRQIAKFLDWKINEIDRLIYIERNLLMLLSSLEQRIIDESLANCKEDSILYRLGSLGFFEKGGGFSKENITDRDNGCNAILYGDIYTKYKYSFNKSKNNIDELSYQNSKKVKSGILLFTGSGETKEEIGKCILYEGESPIALGGDVLAFTLLKDVNHMFVMYYLNSSDALEYKYVNSRGDIIVHIYEKNLKDFKIFIPPIPIQDEVVAYINEKIRMIETKRCYLNSTIDTLRKMKKSLISEVVTGRINVQNVEIPDYEKNELNLDEDLDVEEGGE